MKTWEMIKELQENPEKKFKSVEVYGDRMECRIKMGCIEFIKNKQTNDRVIADRTWKEIKDPVTFMDAVESGKRVRFYYNSRDYTDEYMHLNKLMEYMVKIYTDTGLRNFIKDADWYIE